MSIENGTDGSEMHTKNKFHTAFMVQYLLNKRTKKAHSCDLNRLLSRYDLHHPTASVGAANADRKTLKPDFEN